jgi:hypothetical protein
MNKHARSNESSLMPGPSYAMTIAVSSAAIYSVLEPISDATNLSVAELNAGTGYMVSARNLIPSARSANAR